ncbi:MAG: hypothetical protein GYB31_01145 [Bacteroidetes bacterium]|nr:hypothetical protein [Bacteroidota bacterium]
MKKLLPIFGLLFLLTSCDECSLFGDKQAPDLGFSDFDYINNTCTGTQEYVDTRNFYLVPNAQFPFNGYPQEVVLYWQPFQQRFNDCLGYPWYLNCDPNFPCNIKSIRFLRNNGSPTDTETARGPSAQAFVEVTESGGGGTYVDDGPIEKLPDLSPGESTEFLRVIDVNTTGAYALEFIADPNNEVEERDEANNTLGSAFSKQIRPEEGNYFLVGLPSEEELKAIEGPYVIYRGGVIEVYNE